MFPNFSSTEQAVEYVRENFLWSLRESSALRPSLLPENHHGLFPNFDLLMAMRYAHNSRISEMAQAIFYAMVLNDAAELGLSSRTAMDSSSSPPFESLNSLCVSSSLSSIPPSTLLPISWNACRMAKTKMTFQLRSLDELLAEGTSEGSPRSSSGSHRSSVEVEVNSTSTSSSLEGETSSSGRAMLKKRGHAWEELIQEVVSSLKWSVLEEKYLLPVGYRFVLLEVDATVNKPPAKCIAMYRTTFTYGVRFPLLPMIADIQNKYDLVPAQIMPMSCHNICSFIATCKLHRLPGTGPAFTQVHSVQRAPRETGDLGCHCFYNKKGFMMAIEKKSKVKNWEYDFRFICCEVGWGDLPNWNEEKPVLNPYRDQPRMRKG
ncbi:hypothetical protein Cgig2_000661 [Carnegiea gigantea]|uniref:Uncharacterized protein n=1 Tax=Carnegiea gigantea TaxID=171969 RepID=A0A9Q1JJ67_9CARY|nr:hypothetical protein Cgig2_000661 [Carnegiea gigantea]